MDRAALVPAALVVYCAFNAGGYFPDTPGVVAALLLVALALRTAVAREPFAGLGRGALAAAGALGSLVVWTLLSAAWSEAPARAVLEADRVVSYLLVILFAAAIPWRPGRLRALARALALACVLVCAAALVSRLAPALWPSPPNIQEERLSYPLTYWNALALLAAIGLVLCAQIACEPGVLRVPAAAAFPVLWVTALLTYSRGGLGVAALSLLAFAVLQRGGGGAGPIAAGDAAHAGRTAGRAGLARAVAATLPTSAAAVSVAYATPSPGAGVLIVVVLAALVAAGLAWRLPPIAVRVPRGAVLAGAALALAAGGYVAARQAQGFGDRPVASADQRRRLTDTSSNGRAEYWRVAWRAFATEPLRGEGAGTYQLAWWGERRAPAAVAHAHSVYLETLGELGLPGLLLTVATLAAAILGLWRRRAGPDGAAATALLVATAAWALHAALDWDWQMPAVTLWLWAAAGTALARPAPAPPPASAASPPPATRGLSVPARAAISLGLVVAAAAPAAVAVSENRLEAAERAYRHGRCAAAESRAREADAALPLRPEPAALLGFCARDGEEARRWLDAAVARDPGDWELRYDRAAVLARHGRDPRADLAAARRLNPLDADVAAAVADPGGWKRRVAGARLFLRGLDEPPPP